MRKYKAGIEISQKQLPFADVYLPVIFKAAMIVIL